MTTQTQTQTPTQGHSEKKGSMLATVLRADGVFALLSGAILIVASGTIANLIALNGPLPLIILGVVLLFYGGDLLYFAGGEHASRRVAQAAVVLNLLWVAGSTLGLLMDWFPVNAAGKWAIALLAEVVLLFAILEIIALRRGR